MTKSKKDDIIKLSEYQHARRRPGMYIGSITLHEQKVISYENNKPIATQYAWVPALHNCLREVWENSLDEIVARGYGSRVDINYNEKELSFSVEDNGRGIPIDWDSQHEMHKATLALTHARAGSNFNDDDRSETAGLNGLGGAVVVFCSKEYQVTIYRDGKRFIQKFNEGKTAFDELAITEPKITSIKEGRSGTISEVTLSRSVFKDITLPEAFIRDRVYELAVVNPTVTFYYNGNKIKVRPTIEKELFGHLEDKPIKIDIKKDGFQSTFYVDTNFNNEGEMAHSIVNNIPLFQGGHHIDMFKRAFYSGILSQLEREGKKRGLAPNRGDIQEGILIYNVTKMRNPNFDSQTKTRLINEEAGKYVLEALQDEQLFKDIIRKNKEWVERIFSRTEARTSAKDKAELAREAKRNLRRKVPSLMDANTKNRKEAICFLAEGFSAISGMAAVRNPNLHGGLGLTGKVMNVNGEKPKDVMDNKALGDVMNSLGLGIGIPAVRDDLRYGKVYIAHDMDPDGFNIGALLINFFYTYWPELFDAKQEPFVYIFQTPFIIAEKGKERKYWYADNADQFDGNDYKGWSITRAKGLGSLQTEDWKHALANPKVTPIVDDGKMLQTLDLIFNNKKADDRKNWMGI